MADFFIYQPIDMLNEEHLGDATSSSQVLSSTTTELDKKGYQTTTKYLASGYTKITKHHYPKLDIFSMYEDSRELKGRYKVENHKIYYTDWIAIYGGKAFYSDLTQTRYVTAENLVKYVTQEASEIEIFGKILEASDNIVGSSGGDYLYSFRGDDLVNPGGGDDYVNGGSGTDTVQFSGNRSQYSLARATDSSGIQSLTDYTDPENPQIIYLATPDRAFKVSGPDGNDTLVDVEKLRFKDGIYDIATGAFTEEDNSSSSKGKKGKNKKSKGRKGKKSKR